MGDHPSASQHIDDRAGEDDRAGKLSLRRPQRGGSRRSAPPSGRRAGRMGRSSGAPRAKGRSAGSPPGPSSGARPRPIRHRQERVAAARPGPAAAAAGSAPRHLARLIGSDPGRRDPHRCCNGAQRSPGTPETSTSGTSLPGLHKRVTAAGTGGTGTGSGRLEAGGPARPPRPLTAARQDRPRTRRTLDVTSRVPLDPAPRVFTNASRGAGRQHSYGPEYLRPPPNRRESTCGR